MPEPLLTFCNFFIYKFPSLHPCCSAPTAVPHKQLCKPSSVSRAELSNIPQIQPCLIINEFLYVLGYCLDSSGALKEPIPVLSLGSSWEMSALSLPGNSHSCWKVTHFLKRLLLPAALGNSSQPWKTSGCLKKTPSPRATECWGFAAVPVVPPGHPASAGNAKP